MLRESIFNKNLELIDQHNAAFEAGESTWSADINEFADMDEAERMAFKGYKQSPSDRVPLKGMSRPLTVGVDLPLSVDWRDNNGTFVTPPKNQASCGSCWAHAAIETIESHAAIQLGALCWSSARSNLWTASRIRTVW
eukprot:UN16263